MKSVQIQLKSEKFGEQDVAKVSAIETSTDFGIRLDRNDEIR